MGGAIDERERGFIEPTYSPVFQILKAKTSRILNPNYRKWDDTYHQLNAITMLFTNEIHSLFMNEKCIFLLR